MYIDNTDRTMALLKDSRSVPLESCTIPAARRFTYYDHVHSTGTDVPLLARLTGVITVSKGMTYRDLVRFVNQTIKKIKLALYCLEVESILTLLTLSQNEAGQ